MNFTPAELDMARTAADTAASLVVTFVFPALGAWAVNKHLIQQRWVAMIEAAGATGLAAGNATGKPIDSPEFRQAAEGALLAYAKSQGADVLKSKGMTDDLTVEAGMARVAALTKGMIGPNGLVASPSP